jgi:putative oxidoreductase
MANSSTNIVSLAGRILLSVVFLLSGVMKAAAYSQVVGYAASKGLPAAGAAIALAAAVEILGGLAILAGFQTRIAAWLLFLYLIPTSLIFHNFWTMQGMAQQENMAHFLKNISIMGGLLILAANGPGGASVDASRAAKA